MELSASGLGEVRDSDCSSLFLPQDPATFRSPRRWTPNEGWHPGDPGSAPPARHSPPNLPSRFCAAPVFPGAGPRLSSEFACTFSVSVSVVILSFSPSVNPCLRLLRKPCICLDVCLCVWESLAQFSSLPQPQSHWRAAPQLSSWTCRFYRQAAGLPRRPSSMNPDRSPGQCCLHLSESCAHRLVLCPFSRQPDSFLFH